MSDTRQTDDIGNIIRDLAELHGCKNVTEGMVRQIKSAVANAHIDNILDRNWDDQAKKRRS